MEKIELNNLSLRIQDSLILDGISSRFSPKELTVITGPNGSGKSMLLKCMAGLIKPDSGTVVCHGPKGHVGLIFQDPLVQILGMTVEEDIRYGLQGLGLSPTERQRRLTEALTWTSLTSKRNQDCRTLSGGEKRRLCIASILVLEPDFILFDEPFSNLDYHGIKEVLELLIKLRELGKGLIVVSHDLDRLLAHADRLILLKQGRIIADALPERVLPFLEDHGVRRPLGKLGDMTWLR